MSRFYSVPRIGTGREGDPIRPNLPDGPSWVGVPHTDGTYLVAVPDDQPLTLLQGVPILDAALDVECVRRLLAPANVRRWFAAGRAA